MNERHAVFPGTFDPVTLGHCDILGRALKLFDKVTVAVAETPRRTMFSCAERVALIQDAGHEIGTFTVTSFGGLLVEELQRLDASVVVRGIRTVDDLEKERAQAEMNRAQHPQCEYVFLLSRPEFGAVSGSLVREIARYGGDVTQFVAPEVATALRLKVAGA